VLPAPSPAPGEFALLLLLLIFLIPVALYCLILAVINRRERPVMVSGVWDFVGLLFGVSGFFLVTAPGILGTLYSKSLYALTVEGEAPTGAETLGELWLHWWGILLVYYGAVVGAAFALLWARRNKTVIYNVEPDAVDKALTHGIGRLGLVAMRSGDRLLLAPAKSAERTMPMEEHVQVRENNALASRSSATPLTGHGAELRIDAFLPMCNVTLHWLSGSELLRGQIETALARELEQVRTYDNPAGGWFLGVAGGLFALIVLILILLILLTLPLRR
jgi:hypothetical protein